MNPVNDECCHLGLTVKGLLYLHVSFLQGRGDINHCKERRLSAEARLIRCDSEVNTDLNERLLANTTLII